MHVISIDQACRLLQNMIELPLEGFLLTPVQKICKYPLQLRELLKYTPRSHSDHMDISAALETMHRIAVMINERKRKMESLEKLAEWQLTIDDWQVRLAINKHGRHIKIKYYKEGDVSIG